MDKLQREVRQNDDLQQKLAEQIGRKDENLKKHTEVVERLYDKYRVICSKYKVEPRILLEKNSQGVIDVVLVALSYFFSLMMLKLESRSTSKNTTLN